MHGGANSSSPHQRANQEDRARGIAAFDAVFDQYDVLALPTTAIVAPTREELRDPERLSTKNRLLLRNTSVANFFDLCAVSLPLLDGAALPCGLMLMGRSGADKQLLRAAAAVEAALRA